MPARPSPENGEAMTLDELNERLARACQTQRVGAEGAVHPKGYLLAIDGHTAHVDLTVIIVATSEKAACEEAWKIVRSVLDQRVGILQRELVQAREEMDRKHAAFVNVLRMHTLAREEKP